MYVCVSLRLRVCLCKCPCISKCLGKRAAISDFRITRRGAKGVKTMKVTDKTGSLVAIETVSDEDELLIIKQSGVAIRISVSTLRVMGRNTQGVRLVKINEGDSITSIARIVDDNVDDSDGDA